MKTTAFICTSTMTMAACCLLSGCAHQRSIETISPPNQMPSDQKFRYDPDGASTPSLHSQRSLTNGNEVAATFSAMAVGDAPFYYEWSVATNMATQSISVEVSTNAPLTYQWYKNTNS